MNWPMTSRTITTSAGLEGRRFSSRLRPQRTRAGNRRELARVEPGRPKLDCVSDRDRGNAFRQASSEGKNERTSARRTEERSSEAASAPDCRVSSQSSPRDSPLKIANKTEVSTATALTGVFPSAKFDVAILPARAIHPAAPERFVLPIPSSGTPGSRYRVHRSAQNAMHSIFVPVTKFVCGGAYDLKAFPGILTYRA